MREFAIHFLIRKGLGPDFVPHTVFVAFDDIDPETTDWQLRQSAIYEAEAELMRSEDYPIYGKNWICKDVEET